MIRLQRPHGQYLFKSGSVIPTSLAEQLLLNSRLLSQPVKPKSARTGFGEIRRAGVIGRGAGKAKAPVYVRAISHIMKQARNVNQWEVANLLFLAGLVADEISEARTRYASFVIRFVLDLPLRVFPFLEARGAILVFGIGLAVVDQQLAVGGQHQGFDRRLVGDFGGADLISAFAAFKVNQKRLRVVIDGDALDASSR